VATLRITSRYSKSNLVYDIGLLREGVLTAYLTDPVPIKFVDRDDNTKIEVRLGDRLDNMAVAFYGDPDLWWVIADFQPNPVMEPLFLEPGRELIVPSYSYVFNTILKAVT
jgi:hypothetical protein